MRTGKLLITTLAAGWLATLSFAAIAVAEDDTFDYRGEIIDKFVDPCIIGVVRADAADLSISDSEIVLVVRSFTRVGLEDMLDAWVPQVAAMTEAERHSFYKERLDWCISAHLNSEVLKAAQDVTGAID